MSGWVYTLKLEKDNFYVGFTKSLEHRIAQHFLGRGADWTRIYRPLEVVAVVRGDEELEQAQTIALMCRIGWRNVRGGRYTSPALSCQPIALSAALARAVPMKDPRPAFVEDVQLLDGHVLRMFQSIDGRIVGVLSGSTGEARFEDGGVDELVGKALEWVNDRTGEVKADDGLIEGLSPLPTVREVVATENSCRETCLWQGRGIKEGSENGSGEEA
jgi:hypothetical protein